MPIQIQTPDGVAEFPDGTPDAVIERALQEAYGAPAQAQQQQRQRLVPRGDVRQLPWQQLRQQQAPPPLNPRDTFQGGMESFNRGLPFARDIGGAAVGAMQGGGEALRQLQTPQDGPLDPFAIQAAARDGYQQQTQQSQNVQQQFAGEHPMASSLLEGTGIAASVAPALMTGGATLPAQAQARAPGLFGRMAQGASTGSLYGYAYGAGGADQAGNSLEERMGAGNEGAAMGAAFGAAVPPALRVAEVANNRLGRPAWQALTSAARRLPTPAPNSVGAMGGNLRPPRASPQAPQAPRPPQIPAPVVNYVERNARRERLTPDQLESEFAGARSNPQGQVLNDVLGDNGVRQLRPIVQAPGETSRRAGEVMAERNMAQGDRIINSLRGNLRVSESRQAALRRLGGEYERMSAELYTPLLQQPLNAEQRSGLLRVFSNYADDAVMRDAQRRAEAIFNRDRANGLVTGQIDDNLARYSHYVKMGLDGAIQKGMEGAKGLSGPEMRSVMQMQQRFLRALDDNIPGYGGARAQWGGAEAASRALDEGELFLRMNADEVQTRVAEMTPFELEHARIGMADAISESIGRSGRVVGNANVANSALLNSPEGRRRISAVFMPARQPGQTPEQYAMAVREATERAADFMGTVTAQNRLMRNAVGWNGGSSSYANFAHGDDNAAAAAAEGFVDVVRGDVGRAVNRGARQVGNFVFNNAIERQNNIVGEAALRRIDDNEAKSFTDELVRILREREASRIAQTRATQVGAAGAGAQQRRRE